jgi:hypothetical protein
VFVASLLAGIAISQPAFAADFRVCERILHFARYEKLRKRDERLASLYDSIYRGQRFHSEKKIRDLAYEAFSVKGADFDIYNSLFAAAPADIKAAVLALAGLAPEARAAVVRDVTRWNQWLATIEYPSKRAFAAQAAEEAQEFVLVDGRLVEREFFERITKWRESLAEFGVQTRFIAGQTDQQNRTGQGVLEITGLTRELTEKIAPETSVFDTPEFLDYLKKAEADKGAIVIDIGLLAPGRAAGAYFWHNPNVVPGRDWVIALRPKRTMANWSYFLHEWEHKIDAIDHGGADLYAVYPGRENTRTSEWGRAFFSTGVELESSFLSELNATRRQLKLYWDTRTFSPGLWLPTLRYRAKNQWRVALGRIFLDPANPKHYLLYMRSRVGFYGPIVVPAAAASGLLTALVYYLLEEINEFQLPGSRESGVPGNP